MSNKTKYGILTYHYTTNYGGILQTYATVKLIESNGHEVEVIDYRPIKANYTYFKELKKEGIYVGINKYKKIKKYIYNELPLTRKKLYLPYRLSKITRDLDLIVVGSDEVWKTKSFRGYDKSYFLAFANNSQLRIAFAVSTGGESNFGKKHDTIRCYLSKFSSISVRDDITNDLLKNILIEEPIKMIDPTLMVTFPKYESVVIPNHKYVLLYGKVGVKNMEYIRKKAKEINCKIVSVGYRNDGIDSNIIDAGVEDFLELFRNASIIFTSFFHGVIFSIKFHDIVYYIEKRNKNYKVRQLINDISLNSVSMHEKNRENKIIYIEKTIETDEVIKKYKKNVEEIINIKR